MSDTPPGYPVELLRDDFVSDGVDANKWGISGDGSVSTSSGQLTLDSTDGGVSLSTVLNYDLVSSYVYVVLVSVSDSDNVSDFFSVSTNAGDFYWQYNSGGIHANLLGTYGSYLSEVPLPVYLRVREAAGVVYADYSEDGSSWTNSTSATLVEATELVNVGLSANNAPDTAQFVFSNFNC